MTNKMSSSCIVCGGTRWTDLPDPGPQSMGSDLRVVAEPLAKSACHACGLVCRRHPLADESWYATGYALYAHAPGDALERSRQDEYARWCADVLRYTPNDVLDVGCGNGSLLIALRRQWPHATLRGCDPSTESVAYGSRQGLRVWQGTALDLPADISADLVVSVNVIEHTQNPVAFLRGLRRAMTPHGHLVLVCPDGAHPGLELLIADHVFSFARAHLEALLSRAGLEIVAASKAPPTLGEFQMLVARPAEVAARVSVPGVIQLDDCREYLGRWQKLDASLEPRLRASVVCFGAGEAAGLLRAYAPRSWKRVRACLIDGSRDGSFGELPLIPIDGVRDRETVLVGVRPRDQERVAERLRAQFPHVVTWYDLVDGGQQRAR